MSKIEITSIKRCNSDGTINYSGKWCSITFNASIDSTSTDINYSVWCYMNQESGVSSILSLSSLKGNKSVQNYTYIFPASIEYSYNVAVKVKGAVSVSSNYASIGAGRILMEYNKENNSVGIGKSPAYPGYLEVGFKAIFSDKTNLVHAHTVVLYSKNSSSGQVSSDPTYICEWTNNIQNQTVYSFDSLYVYNTYEGNSDSDSIIVSPSPESFEEYCNCGVRCTKCELDAGHSFRLTFACDTEPSKDLEVNVLVVKTFTDS